MNNISTIENFKLDNDIFKPAETSTKNNKYVLFPREYYSGSDITISFGNVLIDNIVSIEYEMTQQMQSIYGYNSFTWDAVMTGVRFIEGKFKINFKETFYIRSVIDRILEDAEAIDRDNSVPYSPIEESIIIDNLSLNELKSFIEKSDYIDIAKVAEDYEKKLWPQSTIKNNKRNQTMMLDPFEGGSYLTKDGWKTKYNKLLRDGFDIVISFGDELYELKADPSKDTKGTAKVINGVHIMGYKTIYEPSGEPIWEEYRFIARDMDDTISG